MLDHSHLDDIFKALADPTRRALIDRLSAGPATVSALAEPFSLTLAAISLHLKQLEAAGLVQSEKIGRVRTCRLAPESLAAAERWLGDRRALWRRRLAGLERLLEDLPEVLPEPPAAVQAHARAQRAAGDATECQPPARLDGPGAAPAELLSTAGPRPGDPPPTGPHRPPEQP